MIKNFARLGSLLIALAGCQQQVQIVNSKSQASNVIYGEDGRQDIYQIQNPELLQYAKATATFIDKAKIVRASDGFSDLQGPTFAEIQNLCEGEAFAQQKSIGDCTAFLVAPDLIVTAGHCAVEAYNHKIVFDYVSKEDGVSIDRVPADKIYETKRIVKAVDNPLTGLDFALIQLDRPVTDREPLKLRREGEVRVGTNLILIGAPQGIPLKIDLGGKVRAVGNAVQFKATTDSYFGNSGSPVINAETGEVEGILVDGENDFVEVSLDNENSRGISYCQSSKRCTEAECRGEGVTKIQAVLPYLPADTKSDVIFQAGLE